MGTQICAQQCTTLEKTQRTQETSDHGSQTVDLLTRLTELAHTPVLLVASDFDGTLSPIADYPHLAKPDREAFIALHALSAMPHTHVAVISGRALRDLSGIADIAKDVHLVGSHGSEFDPDFVRTISEEQIELRDRLSSTLKDIAASGTGFLIEEKPASVAFHYRNADKELAKKAVDRVLSGPAVWSGVYVKRGKKVIELTVLPTDKGKAVMSLRHRLGATGAFFIGDDESDEDAFTVLRGPDVSVRVGDGAGTRAQFTVADSMEAARVLAQLVHARQEWLQNSQAVPIEAHSMLSDQRTVALVTPDARVVWMCIPRIDSPALFAEILGGPNAGFFQVRSADGDVPLRQFYVDNSFLLKTEWRSLTVTDYLDCSAGRPFQRAGRTDLIRKIEGTGPVIIEFAPRLDFGREQTRLKIIAHGLQVEGSLDPIVLRAPGVQWQIVEEGRHQRAVARHLLQGSLTLELRCGMLNSNEQVVPEVERQRQTHRFWALWADQLRLPPFATEHVRRSALVLKALCYGPTGAISAAGTMSLPEHIGGVRNWDYRYCWLRDGAMSATAMAKLGAPGPGVRLLDWLLGVMDRDTNPEWFRPLYTVTGGHVAVEAEIGELAGYRGSRPVRVGNAAAQQLQLDVFGPIMELLEVLATHGAALSGEHWRLTEAIVNAVGLRWREPDHGIWEIRRPRQHHVHSKVMCWMAVDCGIKLAAAYLDEQPASWTALREEIARDILDHGWNESVRAFTTTYEDTTVDSASLCIGLSGLMPGNDPRFAATVVAVEKALRSGPTLYRYLYDDGLPGREGGFHLCTCWLIQAMVMTGRVDEAIALFNDYIGLLGPTGLIPEEYCPKTRRSLGNHPQAYSHIGLINAALAISAAAAR